LDHNAIPDNQKDNAVFCKTRRVGIAAAASFMLAQTASAGNVPDLSAGVHHSFIHTPMTYEPGWKWSEHEENQARHMQRTFAEIIEAMGGR